jgi:hypothetical protein
MNGATLFSYSDFHVENTTSSQEPPQTILLSLMELSLFLFPVIGEETAIWQIFYSNYELFIDNLILWINKHKSHEMSYKTSNSNLITIKFSNLGEVNLKNERIKNDLVQRIINELEKEGVIERSFDATTKNTIMKRIK